MAEPVLAITGLRKVFQVLERGRRRTDLVALDEVSFEVERGASFGVVGESGSGKTTVARIIVGLEEPTGGRVVVCGDDRGQLSQGSTDQKAWARNVQMVFQDPYSSFDPRQRIGEAIEEVLKLHFALTATERTQRVATLMDQVGLDESRARQLPRALSGGERQRAAIARALAIEPELLILDEAVASLDVSIQSQILNLLADLRDETGISYLVLSHDLAVVRQITDSAIVMREGRIVERGPTERLLDRPKDPYTELLLSCVPAPGWKPRRTKIEREAARPATDTATIAAPQRPQ